MLRLGIIILGISNLLSATIPTAIFMLIIVSIRSFGFQLDGIILLLLMFMLEIVKWYAFYQIIKYEKIKWYSFYILYNIPVVYVAINNTLYFTLVAGYLLAFVILYTHFKNKTEVTQ